MKHEIALALGLGQPAEADPPRRPHIRYLRAEGKRLGRSVQLSPWGEETFRFGWVLGWNGIFWHRAVGIKGPGFWTYGGGRPRKRYSGPSGFDRHVGPLVFCSWRRRGSLRCDRQFARNMGCTCPHTGWLWPISFEHLDECPITVIRQNIAAEDAA